MILIVVIMSVLGVIVSADTVTVKPTGNLWYFRDGDLANPANIIISYGANTCYQQFYDTSTVTPPAPNNATQIVVSNNDPSTVSFSYHSYLDSTCQQLDKSANRQNLTTGHISKCKPGSSDCKGKEVAYYESAPFTFPEPLIGLRMLQIEFFDNFDNCKEYGSPIYPRNGFIAFPLTASRNFQCVPMTNNTNVLLHYLFYSPQPHARSLLLVHSPSQYEIDSLQDGETIYLHVFNTSDCSGKSTTVFPDPKNDKLLVYNSQDNEANSCHDFNDLKSGSPISNVNRLFGFQIIRATFNDNDPTGSPTSQPSSQPSGMPIGYPSSHPTFHPSSRVYPTIDDESTSSSTDPVIVAIAVAVGVGGAFLIAVTITIVCCLYGDIKGKVGVHAEDHIQLL